jgi:hypothetical protein
LQLARYYLENDRVKEALILLDELILEGANLTNVNKKMHYKTFSEVAVLRGELHYFFF